MSEFDTASNHFVNWLKANDATISDSIAVKDYRPEKAGRGVVAIKDIKVSKLNHIFHDVIRVLTLYIKRLFAKIALYGSLER